MAIYEFEGKRPRIGKSSFVPESADAIGDVAIGEIPDGAVAVGTPAKVIGRVTDRHKEEWQFCKDLYADLASRRYPVGSRRIG